MPALSGRPAPTFPRAAGVLLHPTSLPGRFGIGDLGEPAYRWVDWLADSGLGLWQVLPLGPTGFGDSPYQCFSAFAGNPYLVSPETLVHDGLLDRDAVDRAPGFRDDAVEFGRVIEWKVGMLARAHERFASGPHDGALHEAFDEFRIRHAEWLDDFALFQALKEAHGGAPWFEWDDALIARESSALTEARTRLGREVESHAFRQFLFFRQWQALRVHAASRGVRILGDLPIFVSHDSADAWTNRERFFLDRHGRPNVVAGVPPDVFNEDGQLWGNPLYRWDVMARDGFAWWIARVRATLELVDVIRLDHFIGFTRYWEVPASATTARSGRWVPAPGAALFEMLNAALGALPIVAEDLGEVSPEVFALRDRFGLPGMRILEFSFGSGSAHPYLPHHHSPNSVVYTGTHDNEPARAWFDYSARDDERHYARRYLQCDDAGFVRALVRAAFASVAHTAIVPLQDVLELGAESRMNLPGRADGNWAWRFRWEQIGDRGAWLRELAELFGRATPPPPTI